jgi:hypothetical protein
MTPDQILLLVGLICFFLAFLWNHTTWKTHEWDWIALGLFFWLLSVFLTSQGVGT